MIKGIVEGASKKEVKTKFGMKPTYSIKVGGEWYSNGFTNPLVSAGDEVAFEFTADRFGNQIDKGTLTKTGATHAAPPSPGYELKDAPAVPVAPKSAPVSNRPFPIPPLHGDRAIIRQNALGHATRIVLQGQNVPANSEMLTTITEQVIQVARKLEAYACGDLDKALAEEKLMADRLNKELTGG